MPTIRCLVTLGLLKQNQPVQSATAWTLTLTLCGAKILFPAVALSVALLHDRAILDVMFLGLAAGLAHVSRGWGPRASSTLQLTLRTFTYEMLSLMSAMVTQFHSQICKCCRRIQEEAWRGRVALFADSPESNANIVSVDSLLTSSDSRLTPGKSCRYSPRGEDQAPT